MEPRPWTATERAATGAVVLLAAAHQLRFRHPDHAIDDAWISFRIARNLLTHGVLSFNADLPPVEGMTNLLWTLLSAGWIAALPGVDPIGPARILGGACALGAVLLGCVTARRLTVQEGAGSRAPVVAILVAGGLNAAAGSFAWHATSGLETGLWALLVSGALERLTHPEARGDGLGLCLGAAFATRPEAGLLGPALLLAAAFAFGRPGPAVRAAIGFLGIVAAVELFRWLSYGALVPNTFHAKPPSAAGGADYAVRWLGLGGGGGLGLLVLLGAVGRRRLLALVAVGAAAFLGAVATGGDWMAGLRRLTEVGLLLHLVAGVGLAVVPGVRRWLVGLGAAAVLTGSAIGALRGTDSTLSPHGFYGAVGALVAATPTVRSVGIADIGHFGWTFPGEIYDFAGLVDAHIASLPGSHGEKAWDEAWFRAHPPDLVLVTTQSPLPAEPGAPVSLRHLDLPVVDSIRAHGGYTAWSAAPIVGGQWMIAFVRDGVHLPETSWGPPDPRVRALFPPPGG